MRILELFVIKCFAGILTHDVTDIDECQARLLIVSRATEPLSNSPVNLRQRVIEVHRKISSANTTKISL